MKVLNFGSLNIDYVYKVKDFVRSGETISSIERNIFCGGKGLNQSIALSRAGVEVFHAGAIGSNDSDILKDMLKNSKVNTDYIVENQNVPTGHAIIQVNEAGENCIIIFGGANQTITKEQIDQTLSCFSRGDCLLLQNEISNNKYIIEQASELGMVIILNPSPMNEKILELPMKKVNYLLLNEIEASDILGQPQSADLLEKLADKYPDTKIVLTLGEKGCRYIDRSQKLSMKSYKVKAADSTGAGDTFTGYFIAGMIRGDNVEAALDMAAKAAAIAVTRAGAVASIPTIDEVKGWDFGL